MHVVMVAPECAPVAQAGGLGEVVYGLGRELQLHGHAVDVVLPKYDCMRYDRIEDLRLDHWDLWVPWFSGTVHCSVYFGWVDGLRCFFIEPHTQDLFFERGQYYGAHDDVLRFAFFSKAAMEFLLVTGRRPDVIHTHDWQTALVPVLLYEIYAGQGMERQRACHTIHNFGHQGVTDETILWATGLQRPEYYRHGDRLQDPFNPMALNLNKGGIVYANFVTTVSIQHAWEVRNTDQGKGLGHTLYQHQAKFGGVLNGLDYQNWNPTGDPHVPFPFSADDIRGKFKTKEALRQRLWLRHAFRPIVAYAGRLDYQKGVHLIEHAIPYTLSHGGQFILMGSSQSPTIAERFWRLKQRYNEHPDVHLELEWNHELAHLIFAGSDMLVMPSMFEPCGLAQLIAMRYGTVPVVRAIGGLADTVIDRDYASRPQSERNGYVFHEADARALESALARALGLWFDYPASFRELMERCLREDHSWRQPAEDYLRIYEYIRHK